jgi:hypothetical protein
VKEFWRNWKKKPWTLEQCSKRVIEGTQISLPQLSIDSGVSHHTLKSWSVKNSWQQQRTNRGSMLTAISVQKVLQGSDLTDDNLQAVVLKQLIDSLRESFIESSNRAASAKTIAPTDYPAELKGQLAIADMLYKLLGLKYHEVNAAISFLSGLGYEIVIPSEGYESALRNNVIETEDEVSPPNDSD